MNLLKKFWKSLPFQFRLRTHRFIHVINNSNFLLTLVGTFRQKIGIRNLNRLSKDIQLLIVGESYKFPNAYSTNFQVFTKRFLDATRLNRVERKFKYVYADNVVEHLPLELCRQMFSSILGILEPGGSIRLCTPDAGKLVELYLEQNDIFLKMLREDLSPHLIKIEYPVDILRQAFSEFGHHKGFVFDQASLRNELELAGFEKITFHKVGESDIPSFQNLEQRVGGSHELTQLCVEAVKPHSV